MKKVVFIGTGFHPVPPVKGAAVETWIDEVAKKISGYEPYIVSPFHPLRPIEESVDGVTYYRIQMGRLYTRLFKKITRLDPHSYEKRIGSIIETIDPDIVHIHNSHKVLAHLLESHQRKIIVHIHNGTPSSFSSSINAFVGCSKFTLDQWSSVLDSTLNKRQVLYNGVDKDIFQPWWQQQEERKKIRTHYGIDGFLVNDYKNIDFISSKLLWLLDNPDAQMQMGNQGRREVEENFTWQKIAKDTEHFYDSLFK